LFGWKITNRQQPDTHQIAHINKTTVGRASFSFDITRRGRTSEQFPICVMMVVRNGEAISKILEHVHNYYNYYIQQEEFS